MRIINTLSEIIYKKGTITLFLYILIIVCNCSNHEKREDWPVFLHDNRHSGVTAEKLDIHKLHESWVYRSSYPPQPAWAGPAKWDSYSKVYPLRSMRNYDSVFHVIVVGNSLYFGSSVEDAVICLDTKNGKENGHTLLMARYGLLQHSLTVKSISVLMMGRFHLRMFMALPTCWRR